MASGDDLESLAARARGGDDDAWAGIYTMMAPSIFRLCRRTLPTRQDAEDAVSEIFLKARLRLNQFDSERPLRPWLFRIAANHCWDVLRKPATRAEIQKVPPEGDVESGDAALPDPRPSPQEAFLSSESRKDVRRAIRALDARSRVAVSLRYFAEMSYEEIASVLGISSNLVGVLLLRARRAMRKELQS